MNKTAQNLVQVPGFLSVTQTVLKPGRRPQGMMTTSVGCWWGRDAEQAGVIKAWGVCLG